MPSPAVRNLLFLGGGNLMARSLLRNLVSYWPLSEASGPRADLWDGNTLTDNNTVTGNPGPNVNLPLASQFTAANGEWLSVASNAGLQTGGKSYSFSFWMYPAADGVQRMLIDKDDNGANREFTIQVASNNKAAITIFNNSSGTNQVNCASTVTLLANTWYFVVCVWNNTTQTASISINAATRIFSTNALCVPVSGTKELRMGIGAFGSPWEGRICAVTLWDMAITPAQETYLYNSGNGRTLQSQGFV